MDHKSIELSCRFCKRKKPFNMQSIVQHAVKSSCPYNEKQISALRKESKEISDAKHKIKMAARYQRKKKEIAMNYDKIERSNRYFQKEKSIVAKKFQTQKKEHPEVYEQKKQERVKNYDSFERSNRYFQNEKPIVAKKYQTLKLQHPEVFEQKKQERMKRYDTFERKARYQAEKFDLASKYQKRKVERTNKKGKVEKVKNIEKKLRAMKYKKEMARIKQKREEMIKNKASDAGKYFEKELLDPIFEAVSNKMEDDHRTIAYGKVMENEKIYSDQALENVFQSDLWMKEINRTIVLDCEEANLWNSKSETLPCDYWTAKYKKPCIHHMDGSEWDKIIGTALKKSHENEKGRIIQEATNDAFELEWKHAMYSYPDCHGNATRHSVEKAVWHKAFATTFKQKYISIYEESYSNAMDKFMLSENSAHVWKYAEHEKYLDILVKNPIEFDQILRKELRVSEEKVYKEIVEMIEEEFYVAFLKKWYDFKDDVHNKMLSCNNRRMQWAWKKLGEIEKTFEGSWSTEEMKEFSKDTLFQIRNIFNNYESEIKTAYENNSMEMDQYFCFTNYIDTYPSLDFMNEIKELYLKDNYGALIENLWLQLDVEGENCACETCTFKGYCKIDCKEEKCCIDIEYEHFRHKYALDEECEKIARQRVLKKSYRTCRFCNQKILKDEFEKAKINSLEYTFIPLHMGPCAKLHGFLINE